MKAIKLSPSVLTSAAQYIRGAIQRASSPVSSNYGKEVTTAVQTTTGSQGRTSSNSTETCFDSNRQVNLTTAKNQAIELSYETAMNEMISESMMLTSQSQGTNSLTSSVEHQSSVSTDEKPKKSSLSVPVLTKYGVATRTKYILKSLHSTSSPDSQIVKLKELSNHLMKHQGSVELFMNERGLPMILRLREWSRDQLVKDHARQVLALVGYCDPPGGRGIRILSIDGGGTRGIMILDILQRIEKLTGQPIYKSFDLICGVSTGAIMTMLFGLLQKSLDDCEVFYKNFSSDLFKSDMLRGAGRLLMTHAYYDTTVWEKIIKGIYTESKMIETSQEADSPKVMAISAVVNTSTLQPFVFRNFNLPVNSSSYYEGSCKYKIWEAVRASAAAPGYLQEFVLDKYIHQDGGILINNPTAVAIHEAQLLWPGESIQCCISIGSGRFTPLNATSVDDNSTPLPTSLREKISRFIDSATDTELVHRLLQDLLPPGTYFRFNPTLTEYTPLDETRKEKVEQMKIDSQMYLRRNDIKVNRAVRQILLKRGGVQRATDWLKKQYTLR